MQTDRAVMNSLLDCIPHAKVWGLRFISLGNGECCLELPVSSHIKAVQGRPVAGGAITTLLDSAMGSTAFIATGRFTPIVTLDLRVDHLHSTAHHAPLICHAKCHHQIDDIFFVWGKVVQNQAEDKKTIATASGTFMKTFGNLGQARG